MYWMLTGILWVGGAILFAIVGILVSRKIIHRHVAEGHNDVLVPLFLTAGVIYAVLLAFMVIAMWETYDNAKANTAEEASLLVPMYRQTMEMPLDKGVKMRKLLREYTEDAIGGWETFRETAQGSPASRMVIDRMIHVYNTLGPVTKTNEFIDQQFFETLSQLVLDRNKRFLQASESLSWVMWTAAIGGGVVTIFMSFVLFMDKRVPHLTMTSILSALIGMLLFIMLILNRPFIGPLGIEPEPFESAMKTFDHIDGDFKQIFSEDQNPSPAETPAH